jgi:glycerol kinase
MKGYILALDQGTTSSRAIVFDQTLLPCGAASRPLPQIYPRPAWVEHDPRAIWETQVEAARDAIARAGIRPDEIAAIGIANQRETTLVWERETGRPLHNAIVWQCRRTAPLCEDLRARGWERHVREKTGLVVDAYFSAPKLKWLLDEVPGLRERARRGEIVFGTVDTWLLWNLTAGRVHATDASNASRTMMLDIHRVAWDDEILAELDIPHALLPEVRPSSQVYGRTDPALFGAVIPVAGCAGDQQAALFGQACFRPGMVKNTYGTGCFLLMNTGGQPVFSRHGLITTVAWWTDRLTYALEGSVYVAGALIQWLRDGLGILSTAAESESLARSVPDSGGVYLVPAFVGLGAPHWDMYARGTILGITRGTTRAHLVRSALEAICYQTRDVLEAMEADAVITGCTPAPLRADGGAAVNDFLMQLQADILGRPVERPRIIETTALGAACLAGIAVSLLPSEEELAERWLAERRFIPTMAPEERERLYRGWQRAVERARGWAIS